MHWVVAWKLEKFVPLAEITTMCMAVSHIESLQFIVFFCRKNGTDYAIPKSSAEGLENLSSQFTRNRENCIAQAHERFCAGFVGTISENPLGIKEMFGMYEDYMRIEGGAEISLSHS